MKASKLDRLDVYLKRARPRGPIKPGNVLLRLRDMAAKGAPIIITKLKREG